MIFVATLLVSNCDCKHTHIHGLSHIQTHRRTHTHLRTHIYTDSHRLVFSVLMTQVKTNRARHSLPLNSYFSEEKELTQRIFSRTTTHERESEDNNSNEFHSSTTFVWLSSSNCKHMQKAGVHIQAIFLLSKGKCHLQIWSF